LEQPRRWASRARGELSPKDTRSSAGNKGGIQDPHHVVESSPAPAVGLVAGLVGHVPDEVLQILLARGHDHTGARQSCGVDDA